VVGLYASALALYRQGRFEEALAPLKQALGYDPEDGPCEALHERCETYLGTPPPMPFDGIAKLEK
jgi:tetratricopeptide (TPR) repeat protein